MILRDSGKGLDVIDAVLAAGVQEPLELIHRVEALEQARSNEPDTFENLATAYARANNLRDPNLGSNVDESLLSEVEHALSCAVVQAENRVALALESDNYADALNELAALRAPIDLFFERVMIMDKNQALRDNRLRLLNRFVGVFTNVADFSLLSK